MSSIDARACALDPASAVRLSESGLDYTLVPHEGAAFDAFLSAVSRGFLDAAPTPEQVQDSREALSGRRLVGVLDRDARRPDVPVGTVDSWVTELTTEPARTVPMWAISAVTVAPTHRRRGIAGAMIEGELRTAADAGLALAGLTVTEATIYGRWGFGPAVHTAALSLDARRGRWSGPRPGGRLDFVEQDELPARLGALHDRVRMLRGGQVQGWPGLWRRTAGLRPGADDARKVRAVAWTDPRGDERGILVYVITERDDYARSDLAVHALLADGDDAAAALWRYAIEHDLIGTVTASLQPVDVPVRWMVSDPRAVRVTVTDHHWLRVLDVPAALGSRAYAAPATLTLGVSDPLGFAEGRWRLAIGDDGEAAVTRSDDAVPDLELPVAALGSLLLGGVRAGTLAAAGLVRGSEAAVQSVDAAFAARVPPVLGIWY